VTINWNIKKKRTRLKRRINLIRACRLIVSKTEFSHKLFIKTTEYSDLKSPLSNKLIELLESEKYNGKIDFKEPLFKEISELEKKWEII
jgi:hypothetical protein